MNKAETRLELLRKFKLPFCIDRDCSIHTFLRSIAHFKPVDLEQLEDAILRIRELESLKETAKEIREMIRKRNYRCSGL